MNWMDKLERKIGRYAVPNLMLYIIIMYGAGILCTVSLPECTGNSTRTGLEDHYIYHSASVIQSDLDAGGIISLLFYRERTGTGMGDFPF